MIDKNRIDQNYHFQVWDYVVFAAMLILSTGAGVYYGYFKRKLVPLARSTFSISAGKPQKYASRTMSEYLLGSRNLSTFPVAMSLVASYISGVTILGTPAEIYYYGTQYWMICVSIIFMAIAVSQIYLPVFCKLRVGSSYEYLEARFNSHVRSIASFFFVMDEIFFLPIILYVPAVAFSKVTPFNIHIISAIVCITCVIYTLVGGIKAVVHTDAWQVFIMFISVIIVVILGTIAMEGPGEVFRFSEEGGRLNFFDMTTSPYQRHSFLAVLIGGFVYWTSFNSVNQTMVQRYMTLPNLREAKISMCLFATGIVLFVSMCIFAGLLIFSFYKDCDPQSAGLIEKSDELFPIYVMQTIGQIPGVPGIFIAGVFGAALSSLSVVLNSTALVLLEDIVKGCFRIQMTERSASIFVKSSIAVLGVVALSLVFVVEKMGSILSVATSMTAIAGGSSFGMFTLGMLVPWSNSKGAATGALAGMIITGWTSFGINSAQAAGIVVPHHLSLSVAECPFNATVAPYPDESDVFPLYRLSFHWISPIGVSTVVVVGTIVSFLTGPTKLKDLDADLISPVLHRFLPKECFPNEPREAPVQTQTQLLGESSTSEGRPAKPPPPPVKF